jgi:hypothetical protein
MTYLTTIVNVQPGRPSEPLDLNLLENLWGILKRCVEELEPETKEKLIDVIITAREGITMSLANKLVSSMPERLEEVMRN